MVNFLSGLIFTQELRARQVTSVDLKFEPSAGIMARRVDKLGLDIRSFKEPLKRSVQQVMIPSIQLNFIMGGRPPWEPLSEQTVARKGNSKILIDSGALAKQMGYLKIWTIDREKAFIADLPEKVWYGKVHQAGASFSVKYKSVGAIDFGAIKQALPWATREGSTFPSSGQGAIPARPFVMIQPDDEEEIEEIFDQWLGERIARAGLGRSRRTV